MTARDRAIAGFERQFGAAPAGLVFVPGRVNLIGDHVDYNDGLVLPMPIAAGTAIAWSPARDGALDAVALDFGASDRFVLADPRHPEPSDWRVYLRGMAAEMAARGVPVAAARLAIAGDVPRGSGLSSSASLGVAIGQALAAAAGAQPAAREVALAAQAAEHRWAGVNCGIMDQMAVAAGAPGHALLLDCRTLDSRLVPLLPDWAVMIVQSGTHRELVEGHYNERRRACEAAARQLGVASLRDATLADVEDGRLNPLLRRRARHVVSETARTEAAVAAIAAGDIRRLGALLGASHASLRDDFEVSVPPVDRLVDAVNDALAGEGGARMTGGGFGGAIVAILPATAVPTATAAAERTLGRKLAPPDLMVERPGAETAALA